MSPFKNSCASEPHLAAGARTLLPFCASRLAAGGVWKTYETRGGSRAKKNLGLNLFIRNHNFTFTATNVWKTYRSLRPEAWLLSQP